MTKESADISQRLTPSEGETTNAVTLSRLTVALVAVGLVWRLVRYLLQFPIWGDEAMLSLNLLNHDYAGLTRELQYGQIAPIGYLWSQLAVLRTLGSSELAIHLLPFLSGVASLLLFWHLARRTLSPLACTLAVGILAVSIWPISMSTQAKPYAFDLFFPLLLLAPAARWLLAPHETRWLALLIGIVGFAVFASYPAVFVAGAVSLALVTTVWRQRNVPTTILFVVYNLVMVAAFAGNYLLVSQNHLGTSTGIATTDVGMTVYWSGAFPPRSLFGALKWLFLAFTGEMMALPLGAAEGGSIVTSLLCLAGVRKMWKQSRRPLFVLITAPFVLGLIAAVLQRYPFGAARLSQYLVPSIVLLAGTGLATLIHHAASASARRRWVLTTCGIFALIGIGGTVRDIAKPGRDAGVIWARQVVRDLLTRAGNDPVVVVNQYSNCDAVILWYLAREGDRVIWDCDSAPARIGSAQSMWCLCYLTYGTQEQRLQGWNDYLKGRHWIMREQTDYTHTLDPAKQFPYSLLPTRRKAHLEHLDMFHWERR